jgi:poly(3-hydroxybutyrate) depolymerase
MPKPDYAAEGPLEGECPDGFTPASGMNRGFKTKAGEDRRFLAYLPDSGMDTPRPLYVAITGTVQQEDQFANSLATSLNGSGWIVLAPVRRCTDSGQSCYSEGSDGWIWYPWNDGSLDDKWAQEIGPDGHFVEEIARCAAKQWPVDRRRIYIGGISAGGSFTYRNVTYNSKFFAGGVPGSGMWYTKTDTGPLVPSGNQKLLMDNPEGIFDGGCCPRPIMTNELEPMIVIDLWGGASDNWTNPQGNGMLTFDYRPETQAASNYFATQQDSIVYLACSGTQGHAWPMNRDFNPWMANVLLSHPKGTPVADFKMPTSFPQSFSCVRGRFTDHY